jgi:DNA invertase Pin-like site-specific DNA recombinase
VTSCNYSKRDRRGCSDHPLLIEVRKAIERGMLMLKPKDKKQIIEAYEANPGSSIAAIARETRHSRGMVSRILHEYKIGRLDRDGFPYERPLIDLSTDSAF